jgi:single-stranded-DNA-specific exonuclease
LVAGRLTEQYYRPSVILHYGETESHGSCRSIDGFNITDALDQCADLLIRHGGHAQAAGFAVHNENIPILKERLLEIAGERFAGEPPTPTLKIDAEVRLYELTEDLFYELRRLEPTGAQNPAPLLASRRLKVTHKRTIGKDGAHLKLNLADHNCELEAVAFRMGHLVEQIGDYVDAAYRLDLNEWNGVRRLQMVIEDLRPAG